jgi:hypothetical protein
MDLKKKNIMIDTLIVLGGCILILWCLFVLFDEGGVI